jgi:hypothetical protein
VKAIHLPEMKRMSHSTDAFIEIYLSQSSPSSFLSSDPRAGVTAAVTAGDSSSSNNTSFSQGFGLDTTNLKTLLLQDKDQSFFSITTTATASASITGGSGGGSITHIEAMSLAKSITEEKFIARTAIQYKNMYPEWNEYVPISPVTSLDNRLVVDILLS